MPSQSAGKLRVALYTHDTFGLGHVRRCLHLMTAISAKVPDSAILLITGSPAVHAFTDLPKNCDVLKIPTIAKTGASSSQPPHLPIPLSELQHLRERLILEAMQSFAPNIFIADNFPLGQQRELLPALKWAKGAGVKTIVGLRDILDRPEIVQTDWARQGMYEIIDRYYDRMLIYGMESIFNVVDSYALPPSVASKVAYCGYVTRLQPVERTQQELCEELGIEGPFVLATGGGGGDALPLLQAFMTAMEELPDVSSLVIAGPLMGADDRGALKGGKAGTGKVVFRQWLKGLPDYMAAADCVVTMCGYNVAAEILQVRPKAVVVPRTWRYGEHLKRDSAPGEWEQLLRARAFANCGLIDMIEPQQLEPALLAERIRCALNQSAAAPNADVNMNGLESAVNTILETVGVQSG